MSSSIYKCSNEECEYTKNSYFGVCPRCGDGTGYESAESVISSNRAAIKPSKVKVTEENSTSSGIKELDPVLSEQGGFVDGQVISLGALPGTGKSTLTTQLAKHMKVLYISAEETHNQVSKRAIRIGAEEKISILSSEKWDDIRDAVTSWDYDLVVVDSIQAIEGSFLAYSKAIQYTSEITNIVKQREKYGILINQVTKGGEITGHNAIQHITDTVLSMEAIGDYILLSSIKNRFGTVGEILMLEHTETGLIPSDQDVAGKEMPPGAIVINELFGKHRRPVTIESLVVSTSSSNPMRKAVNVNGNKLFTLAALLTKSGLNMSNKDIFINSTIPLGVSQSTDLAVVAAIISSDLEKPISSISGKLGLTGKIKGGVAIFNKKEVNFDSLHDLIQLMK